MRLWPSGITLWSTDDYWTRRAWRILNTHWRRNGEFIEKDVRQRFDACKLEYKPQAVRYLCADIARGTHE